MRFIRSLSAATALAVLVLLLAALFQHKFAIIPYHISAIALMCAAAAAAHARITRRTPD